MFHEKHTLKTKKPTSKLLAGRLMLFVYIPLIPTI